MLTLHPPTLSDIDDARARIAGTALRTPLVRYAPGNAAGSELWLKLESLQPIGSFKLRGAANAMAVADPAALAGGVYTASAGNMAQGVAWCARERGIPCRVVVPEHAPKAKTDAIERLGGEVTRAPFDEWWQTLVDHRYPGMPGLFIHPFADEGVMAGNGTIALEILEDLEDVDAVLVPYGGGGLACGIAAAVRSASPRTRVYAVEVDTASPLTASFASGAPAKVPYTRTFVDGMGSGGVSEEIWPLAKSLLAGTLVVSVPEVAAAVKSLVERSRVVAEGAGAAALAAAVSDRYADTFRGQRVACIVSGGNIDAHRLAAILQGDVPA